MNISFEQYTFIAAAWSGIAIVVFFLLLFITAPYGRHTNAKWGPLVNNNLGWFIMEFFLLITLAYFINIGSNQQSLVNWIIIGLVAFHYINRSLIFPFRLKTKKKKMPLLIALMGLTFNLMNGFMIGHYLGEFKVYENSWLYTPQFIIGILVFAIGVVINWKSDAILIGLRKDGETGYKIPYGFLFRYVSCPNLMGEVIEWLGFAILFWAIPGWVFFLWTFANLVPRALAHHRWYLSHLENYPKRKAVIPGIW